MVVNNIYKNHLSKAWDREEQKMQENISIKPEHEAIR